MTRVGWNKCNRRSQECNGNIQQKCNWGHGETSGHRSVPVAWLHSLQQCVVLGHGNVVTNLMISLFVNGSHLVVIE